MNTNKSEVAYLKEQIAQEYTSSKLAMEGLAEGAARHQFITTKLERVGILHECLVCKVGEEEAVKYLLQTMEGNHEHQRSARL